MGRRVSEEGRGGGNEKTKGENWLKGRKIGRDLDDQLSLHLKHFSFLDSLMGLLKKKKKTLLVLKSSFEDMDLGDKVLHLEASACMS